MKKCQWCCDNGINQASEGEEEVKNELSDRLGKDLSLRHKERIKSANVVYVEE